MKSEPQPQRQDSSQYNKLFIGGLTYNTTDEKLKEFYEQWGEVVDCIVMRDPSTKRSRGFGFVTYSEQAAVDQAMANRPHIIDSKTVEPKRAIPRDMSGRPETNMSVKKLYVSGVREEHTEQMFREYFTEFGSVQEVDIITDKATGKKRGFAFVTFDDYDPVDKCVLQKSHMIDGKRCDVKKALSKEEIKKAEQQTRDRQERDMRSRGTSRGGGPDWSNGNYGGSGGGSYGGGGWGPNGGMGGGGGGGSGGGQWNQGNGSWTGSGGGGWNQGGGYGSGYGNSSGYQGSYGGGGGGGAGGASGGYQGGGWGSQGGWSGQQSGWNQGSNFPAGGQQAGGWNQMPQGWQNQGDGGWNQNTGAAAGGAAAGAGGWGGRR